MTDLDYTAPVFVGTRDEQIDQMRNVYLAIREKYAGPREGLLEHNLLESDTLRLQTCENTLLALLLAPDNKSAKPAYLLFDIFRFKSTFKNREVSHCKGIDDITILTGKK